MKIKQQPEDFQVEELTDVQPGQGPHALYRLIKRGWTTPDALAAIRRRWRIELRRLSYGGLKDRHALTTQYFSIFHGPQRKLTHNNITVEYLGQSPEPYTSQHIRANRFYITLRALPEAQLPAIEAALTEVRRDGLPNYFDDQRFGSVSAGSTFMARELVLGRHEEALKLALTAAYEHDRGPQKKEKVLLRQHWGDWSALKQQLPRGHARSLVDYLIQHPDDWRGALNRLRPELRGLYLSAYQSCLWNRLLALWLREQVTCSDWLSLRLKLEAVPVPRGLTEAQQQTLAELHLPLPSGRLTLEESDPRWPWLLRILNAEGITTEQLKLRGFRDIFFSRGERAAWVWPAQLFWSAASDELTPHKFRGTLTFELPRGSYATLLIKQITTASGNLEKKPT
jgi:tRNA pseudouridine13 synthase